MKRQHHMEYSTKGPEMIPNGSDIEDAAFHRIKYIKHTFSRIKNLLETVNNFYYHQTHTE